MIFCILHAIKEAGKFPGKERFFALVFQQNLLVNLLFENQLKGIIFLMQQRLVLLRKSNLMGKTILLTILVILVYYAMLQFLLV